MRRSVLTIGFLAFCCATGLRAETPDKFIRWQDHPATRELPVTLPRVKNHHWEFAEAVRGGAKPFSHIDHSVPLTEAVLLGCISQRVAGKLDWDAAKGRFSNSEEANALLVPYVRPGWEIG